MKLCAACNQPIGLWARPNRITCCGACRVALCRARGKLREEMLRTAFTQGARGLDVLAEDDEGKAIIDGPPFHQGVDANDVGEPLRESELVQIVEG